MRAVDIIRRKRDGFALTPDEIRSFVASAAGTPASPASAWADYQLSAMLMAIWIKGMTPGETAELTMQMTHSGKTFRWDDIPGPKVDKHSTGGVGDKTSLVLGPLAAACGVVVPMMSGRGLGHTGGTLDKLESIPGFRVGLDEAEIRTVLKKTGIALISQTADVAPADRRLYALRDVTGTVESIPLISASILSKKLAEGIEGLILDVKVGEGAFMKTMSDARELAESLVRVGNSSGVKTRARITSMDAPLGRAVGNSLEVIECIETLRGNGPKDLETLSVVLAADMLLLAGLARNSEEAEARVRTALTSGAGLEKFREVIEAQGGNPAVIDDYSLLQTTTDVLRVTATADGWLTGIQAEMIGRASMRLGGGRNRAEDAIDPAVGIVVLRKPGESVRRGDTVLEIHYRGDENLGLVRSICEAAIRIHDAPLAATPITLEEVV